MSEYPSEFQSPSNLFNRCEVCSEFKLEDPLNAFGEAIPESDLVEYCSASSTTTLWWFESWDRVVVIHDEGSSSDTRSDVIQRTRTESTVADDSSPASDVVVRRATESDSPREKQLERIPEADSASLVESPHPEDQLDSPRSDHPVDSLDSEDVVDSAHPDETIDSPHPDDAAEVDFRAEYDRDESRKPPLRITEGQDAGSSEESQFLQPQSGVERGELQATNLGAHIHDSPMGNFQMRGQAGKQVYGMRLLVIPAKPWDNPSDPKLPFLPNDLGLLITLFRLPLEWLHLRAQQTKIGSFELLFSPKRHRRAGSGSTSSESIRSRPIGSLWRFQSLVGNIPVKVDETGAIRNQYFVFTLDVELDLTYGVLDGFDLSKIQAIMRRKRYSSSEYGKMEYILMHILRDAVRSAKEVVSDIESALEVQEGKPPPQGRVPVYPMMKKADIEMETLEYYDLKYETASHDSSFVVILQEMSERETDILFEHTARLRGQQSGAPANTPDLNSKSESRSRRQPFKRPWWKRLRRQPDLENRMDSRAEKNFEEKDTSTRRAAPMDESHEAIQSTTMDLTVQAMQEKPDLSSTRNNVEYQRPSPEHRPTRTDTDASVKPSRDNMLVRRQSTKPRLGNDEKALTRRSRTAQALERKILQNNELAERKRHTDRDRQNYKLSEMISTIASLKTQVSSYVDLALSIRQLKFGKVQEVDDERSDADVHVEAISVERLGSGILLHLDSLRTRAEARIDLSRNLDSTEEIKRGQRIAQSSRELAAAAKQDSSQMKSIAILTMIFLPGTFVSTFFSMDMFDWRNPHRDRIVTSDFWIYWATAVPLSLLVVLAWDIFTKWKRDSERYDSFFIDDGVPKDGPTELAIPLDQQGFIEEFEGGYFHRAAAFLRNHYGIKLSRNTKAPKDFRPGRLVSPGRPTL